MRKTILSLALMLSALTASAADYSYLTFQLLDGVQQSVSMNGLKIVFSNGNMVAQSTSGETLATIAVASLDKMFFTAEPTGIRQATAMPDDGGLITAYTASGMMAGQFAKRSDMLGHLPKGIYVIKQNGHTSKIVVR